MSNRTGGCVLGCIAIPFALGSCFGGMAGGGGGGGDPATAKDSGEGAVISRVLTIPEVTGGTVGFEGTPAGRITLQPSGPGVNRVVQSRLTPGTYQSTLDHIDPGLINAGYSLRGITCDDRHSAAPSTSDRASQTATFELEPDETITCDFVLAQTEDCGQCPSEGSWSATNHAGSMVCAGPFGITMPLSPNSDEGTLEIRDDCRTLVASGMGDDEATIVFERQPACEYYGSVTAESDGTPMTIHFTMYVRDERWMTGYLRSTYRDPDTGTVCNMARSFDLRAR